MTVTHKRSAAAIQADNCHTPPRSIAACATLACIWEASAPKPGNVHRGADFDDVSYVEFLTSAAVVGPLLQQAADRGVGRTILQAVQATQFAVGTNTNLGTLLLLGPMAAVPSETSSADGISEVLSKLGADDTADVYQAIRLAQPGGMGSAEEADVCHTDAPPIGLVEAMRLAADRDLIARQYTNRFEQVFEMADAIQHATSQGWPLADAITHSFLQLLAQHPDSLIQRKSGTAVAQQASDRAAQALQSGGPEDAGYSTAVAELDFWLRSDARRRNPGTSADLVAAGLFVLLRDERLYWPVRFYETP